MADMVKKGPRGQGVKGSREKNRKEVVIFKTIDDMADFIIEQWRIVSEMAIKEKERFTVALSGGRTPEFLYKKLSHKKTLPWNKTHVFLTDERYVPYEDEESNLHMINDTLLTRVSIPKENVHSISTSEVTPWESAEKYEEDLISFFSTAVTALPEFDLILLGIGEDGHTASLFPETPSLKETRRFAVTVSPKDKPKKDRITITFPVINMAKNIIFLVTGGNKAKIVKAVIEGKNNLHPAAMVEPEKGKLVFLLDEDAGALLKNSTRRRGGIRIKSRQ
jgi:6-phosphogluconolactonase